LAVKELESKSNIILQR